MKGCNSCQNHTGCKKWLIVMRTRGEELKPAFYFLPRATIPHPVSTPKYTNPHTHLPKNGSKKRRPFVVLCVQLCMVLKPLPPFLDLLNAGEDKNLWSNAKLEMWPPDYKRGRAMCTNLVWGKNTSVISPLSLIFTPLEKVEKWPANYERWSWVY